MNPDDDTPEIGHEDIPDTPPDDRGAEPEVPDQPLGAPAGDAGDRANEPLPGIPEGTEPPASG